jgi:hypothetical protein
VTGQDLAPDTTPNLDWFIAVHDALGHRMACPFSSIRPDDSDSLAPEREAYGQDATAHRARKRSSRPPDRLRAASSARTSRGSSKTRVASSKETPCLATLSRAFRSSHSNSTGVR